MITASVTELVNCPAGNSNFLGQGRELRSPLVTVAGILGSFSRRCAYVCLSVRAVARCTRRLEILELAEGSKYCEGR